MPVSTAKQDRLDLRVSRNHKRLIEKAAGVSGQSVTGFVVSRLVEVARQVLASQHAEALSDSDRDAFLQILDRRQPNRPLQQASRRFVKAHG